MPRIGVLGLQGNYFQHQKSLLKLKVDSIIVKNKQTLNQCDGLIIPGGESTAISKSLDQADLRTAIKDYSKSHSIFGTCAGMIMLSKTPKTNNLKCLDIMNFVVYRNYWGSQKNSFIDTVNLNLDGTKHIKGFFIRAPKIKSCSDNIRTLAYYKENPVLISDGYHLASSFHPELTNNLVVHDYFLKLVYETI